MASAIKKIRLEHRVMPVSSEEELNIITLKEQNRKLSNNYNHRIKLEADLRKKVEQLESTLRLCEEKDATDQITIINEDLRNRIEELEIELNRARLNEQRLIDDLDRIRCEFNELRKKSASLAQATNPDSIRHQTTKAAIAVAAAAAASSCDHHNSTSNSLPNNAGSASSLNNSLISGSAIKREHDGNGSNVVGGGSSTNSALSTIDSGGIYTGTGDCGLDSNNIYNSTSSGTTSTTATSAHHTISVEEHSILIANQAKTIQELDLRLADQVELAENRLKELESLTEQHREALLTIDRLKIEAKCIPKEVIIESNEYRTLQSHFSVLYNEATQLKTQLIETRALIMDMKTAHAKHIEQMEQNEFRIQKDLRATIVELEQSLTQTRNEAESVKLNLENIHKANQQLLSMDTELKKSVNSYKTQVQQKNNDISRLKRIAEETKRAAEKQQHHLTEIKASASASANVTNNGESSHNSHNSNAPNHHNTHQHHHHHHHHHNHPDQKNNNPSSNKTSHNSTTSSTNNSSSNSNINNNNSSSTSSSTPTTATTNATTPNNSLNNHSPSNKKILELKEIIHQLQKQLDKTKSEEEALMQDLDVTGQAYEDMQEQNHRLLQQLEEKDDANFKLMSEHLKTNALQKHLQEEKDQAEECKESLLKRISAQDNVVKSLEEKVHLLQENMSTLEKELEMRNTLNDSYKQEKLELRQQLAELKSEKDKVCSQLEQIQKSFGERTTTLTQESFKNRRLTEEFEQLKKKYDRASKMQSATTPDEVLMEEIREYKEQLTCPSCKTKPKDAVLTKCFHVFCFECLRTRVETRQRKCPKCNAQFGANDFHRLYLT